MSKAVSMTILVDPLVAKFIEREAIRKKQSPGMVINHSIYLLEQIQKDSQGANVVGSRDHNNH